MAAQENKELKLDTKSPRPKEKKKMNDIVYGLLAFLVATAIMLVVLGGTFYIIVKNNVNGIGEKLRPKLTEVPVLRMALPEAPDPDDEKYMPEDEVRKKYREQQSSIAELQKQLEQQKKVNAELQKFEDDNEKFDAEIESEKNSVEAERKQIDADIDQLAKDKQKLDQIVAEGDKEGFKAYFENIDKETAAKLYEEIMKEEKTDNEAVQFAKMYEIMEPDAAAAIFQEMGTSKMDTILDIIRNMKKEVVAQILTEMKPDFASQITEKLAEQHFGK